MANGVVVRKTTCTSDASVKSVATHPLFDGTLCEYVRQTRVFRLKVDIQKSLRLVKRYYMSRTDKNLLEYKFADVAVVNPKTKVKPYANVKEKVVTKLKIGKRPARAAFEVEKEMGGLAAAANCSQIPNRSMARTEKITDQWPLLNTAFTNRNSWIFAYLSVSNMRRKSMIISGSYIPNCVPKSALKDVARSQLQRKQALERRTRKERI